MTASGGGGSERAPLRELDHGVVIPVLDSFERVNEALVDVLEGLSPSDWAQPTLHPQRDVKHLAAHLLHGSLRRVTGLRDQWHDDGPELHSREELTAFIQQENREFMADVRRISPQILIELIKWYDPEALGLFRAMDPHAPGLGVAWAGDSSSPRWFDIAREYTEKWHHQQQIRDATRRPLLYDPPLLVPVLETFARGLPFAYRAFPGTVGCHVSIRTTGAASCAWTLLREPDRWSLWSGLSSEASAQISLPADTAWRVWTKSLTPAEAREHAIAVGDTAALEPLLAFVAIMA
jgi:uncharacterized protein (TIGR03083 family)